jgi:hypothetical protein
MIAAASFIPAFRHNYGRDKSLKYFSTGLLSEKLLLKLWSLNMI